MENSLFPLFGRNSYSPEISRHATGFPDTMYAVPD
jgi:hypothetical protein